MDLGARPLKVFFVITLPIIAPALVSGWLLAFTLSLDDLVIASFVAGPGSTTLPMVIFSKVRLGVSPEINALATIMVLIVTSGVVAGIWMRQNKRRQRDMRLARPPPTFEALTKVFYAPIVSVHRRRWFIDQGRARRYRRRPPRR